MSRLAARERFLAGRQGLRLFGVSSNRLLSSICFLALTVVLFIDQLSRYWLLIYPLPSSRETQVVGSGDGRKKYSLDPREHLEFLVEEGALLF